MSVPAPLPDDESDHAAVNPLFRDTIIPALITFGILAAALLGCQFRWFLISPKTRSQEYEIANHETTSFALPIFSVLTICLAACRPESAALTSRIAADKVSVPDCPIPEEASGTHQLIAAAHGICFLYPDAYNAFQGEDGTIMLYVRSMLNDHVPLGSISDVAAEGQTLEALAAQRLADYAWPDTQPESIMLGGEAAVMLDNLPGQDTNRRVVVVHQDRVYDLVFFGIGANYGVAGELAEALYDIVIASIQFIDIDPDAPLLAGPECPFAGASLWYTNEPFGYCLVLPAAFTALPLDGDGAEMAFYIDSIQDKTHARLFIKVADAHGRSLEEATMEREAEIETEVPGSDVMWSWASMLDGEPANEFRQVPGPELSRQVVTLHNGRLYTLTFLPDGPFADKTYAEMQSLYDMVMDSFSFLWQSEKVSARWVRNPRSQLAQRKTTR